MFLWILIQIIIESLPISSSGHVALLQRWYTNIGYTWPYEQIEQINFLLHGPALIITLFYFFTTWSIMMLGKKIKLQDFFSIQIYKKIVPVFLFLVIADTITFIVWKLALFRGALIEQYFLPFGFCSTALLLYITRYLHGAKKVDFSVYDAIILGIAQSIAFLPGISRFAITFCTARFLGYTNTDSFAVSFLIQFPLILAAFIKGSLQIYTNEHIFGQIFNFWMLFAMVGLSFISYKIFYMVGELIKENKIWYFSVYMILPIILSILL